MPSELGHLIRSTRTRRDLTLREFARRIEKSPAFVTQLECEEEVPSVAEETLRCIAKELELEVGTLFVLAKRTPRDLIPESNTEYALYRKVKGLSVTEQNKLLADLNARLRKR